MRIDIRIIKRTIHSLIVCEAEELQMTGLLTRAEQAVSATTMARTFGARLKEVTSGDATHLVIFKDNEPAAVLMGVQAYQAMLDELSDLRAERLATERLRSLNEEHTVSLEDMEARFR